MRFKTGIILDCFQLPLAESLEKASELQVDGIQMYVNTKSVLPWINDGKQRRFWKNEISRLGLEISALCGDLGGYGFEIKAEHEKRILKTKEIIDLAVALDTNIITSRIGIITDKTIENLISAMRKIADYAKERGVYYAIETGPETATQLNQFIEAVDKENLKVNFDPANLIMIHGENAVSAVKILKDSIVHTHAKDGKQIKPCDPVKIYAAFAENDYSDVTMDDFFIELPLGEGDVGFPSYLSVLETIGYSGYLTIEREAGNNRVEDIKSAVTFLKNCCMSVAR